MLPQSTTRFVALKIEQQLYMHTLSCAWATFPHASRRPRLGARQRPLLAARRRFDVFIGIAV